MQYRYCPMCGTPLRPKVIEGRELPACPQCGFVDYQNSIPCVGIVALNRGRVLLVKRRIEPFKGYWDIPGGFLESGEHPADAARREMLEETGLQVEPTDVFGFYMDVYGADNEPVLNICYLCRIVGGEPNPASDAEEIAWFALDKLPDKIAFNWERAALEHVATRESDA